MKNKKQGVKKAGIAAALVAGAAAGVYLLAGKHGTKNRARVKTLAQKAGALAKKGASQLESVGMKGLGRAKKALRRVR